MNVTELIRKTEKLVRDNSQTILTSLGVSGTLSTAYLAARASFRAATILAEDDFERTPNKKDAFKLVWKLYIPATTSAVVTIGCIIGGSKMGAKKTAAAYSLLSVTEAAFIEYKEKVVEQIGEKKEKGLRDEIAQARVSDSTPSREVVIVGSGDVLCYEMHTGRYFHSDMETIRQAVNTINAKCIRDNDATVADFYYLLGLPHTSYSSNTGWTSDKLLELSFSTVLSEDNKPCIAFEYNYVKGF